MYLQGPVSARLTGLTQSLGFVRFNNRLRAVPQGKELMEGKTADNTGRNQIRVAHLTQNFHRPKSMCLSMKSDT